MIEDVRELMRLLAAADRRAAAWCSCRCARTTLYLVHEGEGRPRRAIEVTEAWVAGEATEAERERAADNARAAASYAYSAALAVADAPAHAVARAANAAAAAADPATAAEAAEEVAWAMTFASVGRSDASLRAPHLADLLDLVRAVRWPLTVPSLQRICEAPSAVQVAWDWLSALPRTEASIAELVEAHQRAQRLGLDWSDPVSRAVAERADDEAHVAGLLARGRAEA